MTAHYCKYLLHFKTPSGTSRGVLTQKETWFLVIEDQGQIGIGECGLLRGLSIDDREDYEEILTWVCKHIDLGVAYLWEALLEFPSIQFGIEMAFQSLYSKHPFELFPSDFVLGTHSMPINGLVWMGSPEYMRTQIEAKIAAGFDCIKLKIGAIDFEKELALLAYIRQHFDASKITIRVDANGAFLVEEAISKLKQLSEFQIHSIEQPIKQGQIEAMKKLCAESPVPIALDEELIGVYGTQKEALLRAINPQYVILKPSLVGGFRGSMEWILAAKNCQINWWITSALESNVGLNAIAQWTFLQKNEMPQGLGTGGLYTNNFESPLEIIDGKIKYNTDKKWDFESIKKSIITN